MFILWLIKNKCLIVVAAAPSAAVVKGAVTCYCYYFYLFSFYIFSFPMTAARKGECVCVWELFTEAELLRPWATLAVHWPWEVRHVRRSVDGKCYKNFNSYRCNLNIKAKWWKLIFYGGNILKRWQYVEKETQTDVRKHKQTNTS